MDVFILIREQDYSADIIEDVYADKQTALDKCEELNEKKNKTATGEFENYYVEDWEVR